MVKVGLHGALWSAEAAVSQHQQAMAGTQEDYTQSAVIESWGWLALADVSFRPKTVASRLADF